jgi:3-oxoacyl-[acyl-carrier protein] reductase
MKRVLLTGATGAIGRAIAIEIARHGYFVTLHYRSQRDVAEELLTQIRAQGGDGDVVGFDVTDREDTVSTLTSYCETNGAFYGVVYNVGMHRDAPLVALNGDDWDAVISTNLTGVYNVLSATVMPMVQAHEGGRIVLISSVAGITGNRGQTSYSAAKAGVIALAKSLAQEMAKRDILVNCVAPGFIESEMTANIPREEISKIVPLRRAGKPEEVAGVVGFLFSDAATYLTGQVISPNGGLL